MKTLVPFLTLILLFSCQKNKGFAPTIVMGDLDAVNAIGYNHLLQGSYLQPDVSRLDLDQDGIFDVRFYSNEAAAGSSGLLPVVTLETLHSNIEIQANIREDSMFHAYFYHWQYAPDGTRAYFHTNRTSCERESEQFLAAGVEMNQYLIPLKEGESVSKEAVFSTGKFPIATAEEQTTEVENFVDSTVYHIEQVHRSCFQFPQNKVRYLAFRIQGEYGQKMGWIELNYLGGNSLRVGNWAIQYE